MDGLSILLVLAALGVGGVGLMLSTQATLGVAIIAFGCLLAILARMAQASSHHGDVRQRPKADRDAADQP